MPHPPACAASAVPPQVGDLLVLDTGDKIVADG